jgi:hypothetical protein
MTVTLMNSYFFLFSRVVKLIPLMSFLACYYYSAGIMKLTLNRIVIAAMMVESSVRACPRRFLRGEALSAAERILCPDPAPSPLFDQSPNIVIDFGGFTNDGSFPGVSDKLFELSRGNVLIGLPNSITTQQNLVFWGTTGLGSNAFNQANSFPTQQNALGDTAVLTNNALGAISLSLFP